MIDFIFYQNNRQRYTVIPITTVRGPLEIELTYYRTSFGILDQNNIKTPMINFTILIAKYWIFASTYKMQRPPSEGLLKILHERKETEHYIALAKDKLEHYNQKWGFLRSFEKGFVHHFAFFF